MDEGIANKNNYQGNGWSQYQIMVLAQLDSHTLLLKDLMKEVADIKQRSAVSDNNDQNWRDNTDIKIRTLQGQVENILYGEKGLTTRVGTLEQNNQVTEKTTMRFKGLWAFVGGVAVVVIDIALKTIELFLKK